MKNIVRLLILLPCFGLAVAEATDLPSPQKRISFMSDKTPLKAKDALLKVACRPISISESGPLSTADAASLGKELTVALGPYRFIRTDIGNPDGTFTLTRGGKEICIAEISLLTSIRFLASRDLILLKFSSGSGQDWQLFQAGNVAKGDPCVSLGLISNTEAIEFEQGLLSLKSCR